MNWKDMKIGMRVKCTHHFACGDVGTIADFDASNSYIEIKWDNPHSRAMSIWSMPGSFEPLEDNQINLILEAKCRNCDRLNFTDAKKCWWCDVVNPTSHAI